MTSTTGRGPYAKTKLQRANIIDAALDYFGQYGYHGASMREIARHVGLSQAGLLHHFRTKSDLLIATLESRDKVSASIGRAVMSRSQNPLDGITAIVEDNASQRQLVQMFTVISAEATDEAHPAHEFFVKRHERVIRFIAGALTDAVERGLAPPELDINNAAQRCQAMMYGLQVQWLLDPSADMVALFQTFLDDLCRD